VRKFHVKARVFTLSFFDDDDSDDVLVRLFIDTQYNLQYSALMVLLVE
jgi:hypothetical protein